MNISEQLAHLRQTVAQIDSKYAGLPSPAPRPIREPDSAGLVEAQEPPDAAPEIGGTTRSAVFGGVNLRGSLKAQEPPDAAPEIGGTTRSAVFGGVNLRGSLKAQEPPDAAPEIGGTTRSAVFGGVDLRGCLKAQEPPDAAPEIGGTTRSAVFGGVDLRGCLKAQEPPDAAPEIGGTTRSAVFGGVDLRGSSEEPLSGEVVETPFGKHFETEKLYPRHQRYGSYEISDLIELPHDFLASLSANAVPSAAPATWAFLDTETTGLAGGSGTCAFLIGVGSIDREGFRVRQFFMRDYCEEPSMLHSLAAYLSRFDVLITYNGKSFDQPLLETRYTMCRARHPFASMAHLDLLYGARRLFKLRLESCRLVNLEYQILGLERDADVPGELIPYYYFEYLRTRHAFRLIPVFHHNVLDIVSLACLTGLIPAAFRDPENIRTRHGADLLGLARWLQVSGRLEEAHRMMRRAIDMGLPDQHLFRALFDAGNLEKKLGFEHLALATFTDLSLSPNPFRVRAYEELAKHYEHRERNYRMALECVRAARSVEDSKPLAARQLRLETKTCRAAIRGCSGL